MTNDKRLSMRSGARLAAFALLSLAVSLAAAGPAGPSGPGEPAIVGELEEISIGTPHPYPSGIGRNAREWIVAHPGATYIRIHFSRFELAPGDRVEVSRPDGLETSAYEGFGPHGTGEFWAFSVSGDTAIVRLQAFVGGAFGFEIDSFGRGIVDPINVVPGLQPGWTQSICGTQDWKDVKCYESGYPTEYERSRGSVLALIGCCTSCSAFKVSDSGQFMTNNHCTATQSGVQSTELRFEFQNAACGGGGSGYTGSTMGSQLLRTNGTLDYTLFTTTSSSSSIPCLQLDNRLPPVDERIYIPGHPNGGVKKLSLESTHPSNPTGFCEVDASPYPGNDPTSDIGYYCDTIGGSSGSPVLSGNTHKVVAIHHFGGCLNSGVRMDRIVPQISDVLDSCAGGGGETCGNGTCAGGETSCSCPADCGPAPSTETSCSDGVDNDCDGAKDCADADCAASPSCTTPCGPSGASCVSNGDCCSNNCRGKPGRKTCK